MKAAKADIIRLLRDADTLWELSEHAIAVLAEKGTLRSLKTREMLFHEGFEGNAFFLLIEGSIKVYKTTYDGRETVIKNVRPGEIFGEVILFENDRYSASGVATTPTKVLVMPRDSFMKMLDDRAVRDDFVKSILKKLRYLTGRMHYLTSFDVEERFFRYLREHYGEQEQYRIDLSKKDFAAAIGTIPETMSRLILRLTKRGIIEWERKTLKLRTGFWDDWEGDE